MSEKLLDEKSEEEELKANNPEQNDGELLLEVKDLKKYFVVDKTLLGKPCAYLKAVDGVSLSLKRVKLLE